MNVIEQIEKEYPETAAEFKKIQQRQYELFCRKQSDYGPSNILLGGNINKDDDVKASVRGIVIRLNDKLARLINLILKKDTFSASNESIEDTFNDASVYSIIALIVLEKKWGK